MKRNLSSKLLFSLLFVFIHTGGLYSQKTNKSAIIYPAKKNVLDYLSQPAIIEKYGKISDEIWSHPELGLQEFKSSALIIKTLEEAGFSVEKGLAGMPTCFVGTYGSGKPVIGILLEFDALPGISQKGRVTTHDPVEEGGAGHGCGHNIMGTASTAAAIAVKQSMEKFNIKGTIKVFGSPAEETLTSRPYMVRAGLFEGVDAVIDNHSASGFGTHYGILGNAMFSSIFTFTGKSAHSAETPWNGRSALDAVEIMNVSTNFLREHLHYTHRMHYVIPDGGNAPNVVPDKASVWYFVRETDERVADMYERVINCAKGAALATGTKLEEIRCLTAIHQLHYNKPLAELLQSNIELIGMPVWTEEENAYARELQKNLGLEATGMPVTIDPIKAPPSTFIGGGSSDVGDVTLIAPTAPVWIPGLVPGAIFHHWSLVSCTYGSAAWKGLAAGAKVIASSAVDMLTKPDVLQVIRKDFEEYSKLHPYIPLLPEGSVPYSHLSNE